MSQDPQSLFRAEVLAAQSDQASGATMAIRPVGARVLTLFFAALAVAVIAVLLGGSYTKKERVQGVVQAVDGVAVVSAQEPGTIQRVRVKEGQQVQAGEVIAEVSNERYTDAGNTQALLEQNLDQQRTQVQAQAEGQAQAHQAALATQQQRMAQARRDLGTLREEARLQAQQIASSQKLLDQLRPLLDEHIISELQYTQQHQALLEQTARLQTLKRQLSASEADLAQAQDESQRQIGQQRATRAGLDRDLLSLQQAQVQQRGARLTLIKAPVAGVISGLQVKQGQGVSQGAVMASVVPGTSAMEAVLYMPSTAVGFIRPGQAVRVSYDAFPYQRFGQYPGTVRSVSQADVTPPSTTSGNPDRRAVFLVHVALAQSSVRAYSTQVPLRPGHTLTADIEVDRRRLIHWMLDPLFAFSGRL